jgi:ribosomal protein S18 acetylase RimI-like enzyme
MTPGGPSALLIRPASTADADAIWAILREVIDGGEAFAFDQATTREDGLRFWLHSPTCCFVAEQDGQVIGSYFLRPNQPGRGAHVANGGYMVARSGQGRGVGRLLAEHSMREAAQRGFRAMQFNMVIATNTAAVRLWMQLGFAVVGRIPGAFVHSTQGEVDALIMHRTLHGVR